MMPTGLVKSTIQASGQRAAPRPCRRCRARPARYAAPWRSRPARSSPGRAGRTCPAASRPPVGPRWPPTRSWIEHGRRAVHRVVQRGRGAQPAGRSPAGPGSGRPARRRRPAVRPRCRAAPARRPARTPERRAKPSISSGVYVLPPPITAIFTATSLSRGIVRRRPFRRGARGSAASDRGAGARAARGSGVVLDGAHRSIASGQRRGTGSPARVDHPRRLAHVGRRHRPPAAPADRARPTAAAACTGASGRPARPRSAPDSTMCPAYMTSDPVGDVPGAGDVVGDVEERDALVARAAAAITLSRPIRIETSSMDTGSSARISFGR